MQNRQSLQSTQTGKYPEGSIIKTEKHSNPGENQGREGNLPNVENRTPKSDVGRYRVKNF